MAGWITDELRRKTQAVWSGIYVRDVSAAEADEILMNVKNLAEVLLGDEEEDSI